jgi:hypothetical protein
MIPRVAVLVTLAALACQTPRSDSDVADKPAAIESARSTVRVVTPDSESFPASFAYVGPTGTELLALAPIPDHSAIRGALCGGGRVFPVRFKETQAQDSASTYRQIASNFRRERGEVFEVLAGAATPDETCFLTADSLLLSTAGTVRALANAACSEQQSGHLSRIAGRAVVHCWRLYQTSLGAQVLAAQFATDDSSALAGIALVQDSVLAFFGIPAAYHGPDMDIWRVDDQGVFSPEFFGVLFAARLGGDYALALTWAGTEGESDTFLLTDSTHIAREVVKAYRYWVPE